MSHAEWVRLDRPATLYRLAVASEIAVVQNLPLWFHNRNCRVDAGIVHETTPIIG